MSDEYQTRERTTRSTRRTVLKTVGGAGLAAATVPGFGSAASDSGFLCSLDIPSLFYENGAPVDPHRAGTVYTNNTPEANGIFVPDDVTQTRCGGWFSGCDAWRINLPFAITWKTDASWYDIGQVYIRVDVETPSNQYGGWGSGWSTTVSGSEATLESRAVAGGLQPEYPNANVPGGNLFRPTYVTLTLDFSDSNLYDGQLSETARFAIPNQDSIQAENLVSVADSMYDQGVTLANRTVSVPLNQLRRLTRLWAYSSVAGADMIDPDGIAANAVVKGISAFKDPIEERRTKHAWGQDFVETYAGPAILRQG